MHHCTGVNDYTRCKESRSKPVVPNKHFQPRNCCRLSCKHLTCGSALKCDYKMHCGFLLHFSDTILHLLSLQIKKPFFSNSHVSKLHVNISKHLANFRQNIKHLFFFFSSNAFQEQNLSRLSFISWIPLQMY